MALASTDAGTMTHHDRRYTAAQGAYTSAGIPLTTLIVIGVGMSSWAEHEKQ